MMLQSNNLQIAKAATPFFYAKPKNLELKASTTWLLAQHSSVLGIERRFTLVNPAQKPSMLYLHFLHMASKIQFGIWGMGSFYKRDGFWNQDSVDCSKNSFII
jgi:hypothetical protein